ncbi:glycosyltransferase [Citrifermentans bremense]|uniref:glycosyltransferase n=1 Tax=Citrifermentans bremense TaxID=60035 RepID=UPI0003FFD99D|nr:glycosyltransferase [Citrifermentans bremense]
MARFLTIITVTKDDLCGVAATLESAKRLRALPGVSHLIVDGSSASVRDAVQAKAARESVEYLWCEPEGIGSAFNRGIDNSDSDWIWFLNGRDEVHPDLDAELFLRILEGTRAEAVIFELSLMQSGERHAHPPLSGVWPPLYWVPHPATLLRRSLFQRYGRFDQGYRIAMDGELWVRFFSKDLPVDLVSIPICLFDQNGISATDRVTVEREADRIILANFRLLLKLWLLKGRFLCTALRRRATSLFFPCGGYRP